MAIICGVVMCIFTISFSSQLDSSEIGSLIGWTIGSCLAILWSGRVVELLQDMRDDGRDLTAIVRREVAQSEAEETLPHSWNEINAKYEE
jgi:putative exporter of polyketide antibiotics